MAAKRMGRVFCLVWESLFLVFCLRCLGEEPRCKACWTVWISTDVPRSNSFPGLFGKEMCTDLCCTTKVKPGCRAIVWETIHATVPQHEHFKLCRIKQPRTKQCPLVFPMPCSHVRLTHMLYTPTREGTWNCWHYDCRLFCSLWHKVLWYQHWFLSDLNK